jgi:hypothetical protein
MKFKAWEGVLFWARIPIVVIATAFPVVFAKHIESHEIGYIAGFVLLVAFGAAVEVLYDREVASEKVLYDRGVASELEGARRRLQALKAARGLTMRRLLELLSPLMGVLANRASLSPDQRKTAAQALDKSIVEILKATCEDVWTNWNEAGSTAAPFKASVMVAHKLEGCDPARLADLKSRVKFVGFGRDDLTSYKHILDVQLWSDDENPLFVPIAIPVEDEGSARGVKKLLPGAPTAFAQGDDVVISDTHELQGYCGPDLESDVLKEEQDYFESRKIRSMACLVLHENGDKKQNQNRMGVLNIHSDKVNVFGSTKQEQLTIIQSLAHYRTALEFLLDGQQQLTA